MTGERLCCEPGIGIQALNSFWVLGLRIPGQFAASRPYSGVRDIRLPEQVQGLPELLLGRLGRHGPESELSGYECGGGVVEAYGGPGIVLEGEGYGLANAWRG